MIYLILLALVLLMYFIFFHTGLIFMFLNVSGPSMNPTFYDGDFLLSIRTYFCPKLKLNDIVIAKPKACNGRLVIKRICGMKKDDVTNRYIYYIVGDNAENSFDSRNYGWISQKEIVAKVVKEL